MVFRNFRCGIFISDIICNFEIDDMSIVTLLISAICIGTMEVYSKQLGDNWN